MHVAVIAFIMVLLMRFLAAIIVWVIVVLAAIGSIGLHMRLFSVYLACIVLFDESLSVLLEK